MTFPTERGLGGGRNSTHITISWKKSIDEGLLIIVYMVGLGNLIESYLEYIFFKVCLLKFIANPMLELKEFSVI